MDWLLAKDDLVQPPPLTEEQIRALEEAMRPLWYIAGIGTILWLVGMVFTLWMVIECYRRDPEWNVWLWIILCFPALGPMIYFLARWLPNSSWELPAFLKRWTSGGQLRRLEIATQQIGNPHQFVEWGDGLREVRRWAEARAAYVRALAKEPKNLLALWGVAHAEMALGEGAAARDHLQTIMEIDSGYKFGDASLLLGKALRLTGESAAELAHWRTHSKRWRQPEAMYCFAEKLIESGAGTEARIVLQAIINDLELTPRAISRKFLFWKGRAKRLMKQV